MLDRSIFLRPIAHRGLHDARRGIVENTGPAFEAAIAAGFGIECDVRPAAGGLPVVFHDKTIERLVGGKGIVSNMTGEKIAALRHRGSGAPVLTLDETCAIVGGRVPLLIEIKSEWEPPQMDFLHQLTRRICEYPGPAALMSFDPDVMKAVRDLAPRIPRGIVSGSFMGAGWQDRRIGRKRAAALRDLLESGPAAPHFYAYDINALPTPVTEYARRVSGLPLFTWTVRTPKQRRLAAKWADAMIFEGFDP